VLWLWLGEMESFTERGFMCCNVVMCAVVMVGGNGNGYRKGFYVL
jgi:hypothetical protein